MACAQCHYFEYHVPRLEILHRKALEAATVGTRSGTARGHRKLKIAERKANLDLDIARAELNQHRRAHHTVTK